MKKVKSITLLEGVQSMKVKVAINGFGRIGRMVFRKAILDDNLEIIAVNASYPAETLAHLIKYDTVHGKFAGEVKAEQDALIVNGKKVQLLNNRNPEELRQIIKMKDRRYAGKTAPAQGLYLWRVFYDS